MTHKRKTSPKAIPTSFRFVQKYKGIEEYELKKNGLRILYGHTASAPVTGFMVTYLVGSRHEVTGHTGSTHILEHLMFKGSKKYPLKRDDSVLNIFGKIGASANASTWFDRTNYYEVLPDEHFELAVSLEADRMRNARIDKERLGDELPAVLSEYAMHVNEPESILDENVCATAYLAHPYHHTTLGWLSDIENASVDTLKKFYDTYYHPNNAIVVIVGNTPRHTALSLVGKYFGVHPKSSRPIPIPHTTEPQQTGKRFLEVKRQGTKNVVSMAYKTPHGLHEDTPALLVLSALLGEGKTSRLHRALVEKNLAAKVWSFHMPFYDPFLMMLYAVPVLGVSHEKVEQVIQNECKKIKRNGVTKTELTKVIEQTMTEIAFARDGISGTLSSLTEAIAVGNWRYFFELPLKLEKVTSRDVQRVAKKYLQEDKLTVGYYRAKS